MIFAGAPAASSTHYGGEGFRSCALVATLVLVVSCVSACSGSASPSADAVADGSAGRQQDAAGESDGGGIEPDAARHADALDDAADASQAPAFDASHDVSSESAPGLVTCGNVSCDNASTSCCGDPGALSCVPTHNGCSRIYYADCDDDADCSGGVCCVRRRNLGQNGTQWLLHCVQGSACLSTDDARVCPPGGSCGGSACVQNTCRGATVYACGALPQCT